MHRASGVGSQALEHMLAFQWNAVVNTSADRAVADERTWSCCLAVSIGTSTMAVQQLAIALLRAAAKPSTPKSASSSSVSGGIPIIFLFRL